MGPVRQPFASLGRLGGEEVKVVGGAATGEATVVFRHYRIGYLPHTEARALRLACQRASVLLAPLAVQLLVKDGLRQADETAGAYRVRVDAAKPFRFG